MENQKKKSKLVIQRVIISQRKKMKMTLNLSTKKTFSIRVSTRKSQKILNNQPQSKMNGSISRVPKVKRLRKKG